MDIRTIDARALAVGLTLSQLAKEAQVSSATLAKIGRGDKVRPRSYSKLSAKLDELERAKG